MQGLSNGQFYGTTNQTLQFDGLTITDTEYTHAEVEWHYHENAYFTFILKGKVYEGNKKELYHCTAGDLLFHNWQDAHYNRKPPGFTRGFHIELQPCWFSKYDLPGNLAEGSIRFKSPALKLLMYRIFAMTKQNGPVSAGIESSLIELLGTAANGLENKASGKKPAWVKQLEELMHDEPDSHLFTLIALAGKVNILPVHLSRTFPIYFQCRLGDYLHALKMQRALKLLTEEDSKFATVAAQCGFSDQSHLIRSFKRSQQLTPFTYRKLFSGS